MTEELSIPPPKNILIKMPNWVGDLVMATPILEDLKNHFKEAEITVMCLNHLAPLLKTNPYIDAILAYKKPSGWIHKAHFEIIAQIKKGQYDLGLLLTNSLSSAWWFWRGKVKIRIGFKGQWRAPLLTKALSFPKEREREHQTTTYKRLLLPLHIPLSETQPKLFLEKEERDQASELLKNYGIDLTKQTVIGLSPGAAYGSAKCWPIDHFQELSRRLLEDEKKWLLFFGDNLAHPLIQEILKPFEKRVINLAGKTSLRELMALLSLCHFFVTNDSGPMHIAAALGVPLVALFGSTNPLKTGPKPQGQILYKKIPCSPCYERVCPKDFRCMREIEVEEVLQAVLDGLKNA